MHYIITGGSGFIGRALIAELNQDPATDTHRITVLSRQSRPAADLLPSEKKARCELRVFTYREIAADPKLLQIKDSIFINLAGENIAAGRLGLGRLRTLLQSRRFGIDFCLKLKELGYGAAQLFVQASALSLLEDSDEERGEDAAAGQSLLSGTLLRLEQELGRRPGQRTLCLRLPMVLGQKCVLLQSSIRMPRVRLIAGCNYLPWISVYDCARAIHAVCRCRLQGSINIAAPHYATAAQLLNAAGQAAPRHTVLQKMLGRLPPLPCCPCLLRPLTLFDRRVQLILENKKIRPERLLQLNFKFADVTPEEALRR